MDFTTTEAADDLGGLVRTITESVCTPERQRELDGLDERFDRDLWAKLGTPTSCPPPRRRSWAAAVSACSSRSRCWSRSAGSGRGALPGVGRARRGRPGEVRLGGAAAGVGGARGQRREDRSPSALDGDMGEGPVQADGERRRLPADRHRTQVVYGPVADAFLVPAETDSGTTVFLVAADDPGVTVSSLDTTGHGSVGAPRAATVSSSAPTGVVGGDRRRRRG